jgi:hypothetical protein
MVAAVVGLGPLLVGLQLAVLRRIGDPETKKSFGNFVSVQMLLLISSILLLIHYHLYRKIISHTVRFFLLFILPSFPFLPLWILSVSFLMLIYYPSHTKYLTPLFRSMCTKITRRFSTSSVSSQVSRPYPF